MLSTQAPAGGAQRPAPLALCILHLRCSPSTAATRDEPPEKAVPQYRAPGVYVEEVPATRSIEPVATSTCAFVGPSHDGPAAGEAPPLLTGFDDFARIYGDDGALAFADGPAVHHLARAVRAFFAEGGRRLYVLRLAPSHDGTAPQAADYAQALAATPMPEAVSILAAPGASAWCRDTTALHRILADEAGRPGARRFAVLDTPPGATPATARTLAAALDCSRAALYYPWIAVAGDGASPQLLPPSGFVCGIYARSDQARGVHGSPANEALRSAVGLERPIGSDEQALLNPAGVNCLRLLPGRGYRVWGARTLSHDPEWKYIATRRYLDHLETCIERGTGWVVFEPNGPALWARVRAAIDGFLHTQWQRGALVGTKPEQAWFVRCDAATMTAADIDNGRTVCVVGVAPGRPGEFIVLRFAWQAQ